jgi:hypothetical protein
MNGPLRSLVSKPSATSCLPAGASPDRSIAICRTHSDLAKFAYHDSKYEKVVNALRQMQQRYLDHISAPVTSQYAIGAPQTTNGGINVFSFSSQSWTQLRKSCSTVPFQPDPGFVDRPDIALWLRQNCSRLASRAALVGLGGVG